MSTDQQLAEKVTRLEALAAKQQDLLERQQELLDAALKANKDTFRWYAEYNQLQRATIERHAEIRARALARRA